jgi:hypothetical protein
MHLNIRSVKSEDELDDVRVLVQAVVASLSQCPVGLHVRAVVEGCVLWYPELHA